GAGEDAREIRQAHAAVRFLVACARALALHPCLRSERGRRIAPAPHASFFAHDRTLFAAGFPLRIQAVSLNEVCRRETNVAKTPVLRKHGGRTKSGRSSATALGLT